MKDFYYSTNRLSNNQHIIHTMECEKLPSVLERTLIGFEESREDAIRVAQNLLRVSNFECCAVCCPQNKKIYNSGV